MSGPRPILVAPLSQMALPPPPALQHPILGNEMLWKLTKRQPSKLALLFYPPLSTNKSSSDG
eukprot:1161848-Pelagomonas_calceolata.AAC.2